MPKALPLPRWDGLDAYCIGGGHSLAGFDFGQLAGRPVVGCNEAFTQGPDICTICLFGDERFWRCRELERQELSAFGGWVATNYQVQNPPPWLKVFGRINYGLGRDDELAWNGNTGAMAINLALALGAQTVFLLGYDMHMKSRNQTHWHGRRMETPTPEHYFRFSTGCETVAGLLPSVYPNAKVYNVNNGTSRLLCFPMLTFEQVGLTAPQGGPVLT